MTTLKENQRLNALSMSSSTKKEEYRGLNTTPVALAIPRQKNENMIKRGLFVPRKMMVATVNEAKPTNKSFLVSIRSAIMPIGIVRMAALSAFIMKMEPMTELLYPMDVKYNCMTTLNIPFPIPLKILPKRNSFAGVEILSGMIDFRFNASHTF